jgi:hypothetical protein
MIPKHGKLLKWKKSQKRAGWCGGNRRRGSGEIIRISNSSKTKSNPVPQEESVITIYTGLPRWWRDRNWRTWLIFSLFCGILLGLLMGQLFKILGSEDGRLQ